MNTESTIDYNALMESHTIISRTDLEGNITYVNHNFCEASGYVQEELIGKSHNLRRHPDVSKNFYKKLWDTIQSDETWHGVMRNLDKQGHEYFTNATIFPILNSEGEKEGYMSIHYLVTEEENIKHNLKKQVLVYKSEQLKYNRELQSHDLELRQAIENEIDRKYKEYLHTTQEELQRLKLMHRQDVANVRALEDELKNKKKMIEDYTLKSKKTIQTLSSERVELIQSVEALKKSNESYKNKMEKAQESVVTFQGYIDEYRKKIDDLKDVIASYESDQKKEEKVAAASTKESEQPSSENEINESELETSNNEDKKEKENEEKSS